MGFARAQPILRAGTLPHSRGMKCPGGASSVSLESKRAQGMPDASRTRSLVCNVESTRVSHRRHAERSGIPCTMVFSAYNRTGERALIASVACRLSSADLTPASGGQDHTPLPSARNAFVGAQCALSTPSVHRIPLPTSVTIAIRPSCGGGMSGEKHIFLKNGSRIFLLKRLDMISD
jgi:hypothetical protein